MEKETNIAEILKDKPRGTKLYSPVFRDVTFCGIDPYEDRILIQYYIVSTRYMRELSKFGKYCDSPEPLIFPSKEMRDWSKFVWKKGDVLVSNDGGREVIFDGFEEEGDYTYFKGKYWLDSKEDNDMVYSEGIFCKTLDYSLEDKDAAQCYINTIEERLGSKLNMETLEVEKPKCEFKPFDKVLASIKGDAALIILVGEDIQKFERIIDGMFFLKGLEEGISLMKGEIG